MRKRRVVYFVLIIALVTSATFAWYMAPLERISGLPPITGSQKRAIYEALYNDQKKLAGLDVTAEQATKMSTSELLYHLVTSKLANYYLTDDNKALGIYRVSRVSPSLAELLRRDDLADGFIKGFEKFEIEKEKIEKTGSSRLTTGIMSLDDLAQYPPIFEKFKGEEKKLLAHVCKRYQAMRQVDIDFGRKHSVFGRLTGLTKELALKLARQLDSKIEDIEVGVGDNSETITEKEDKLMKSLERLYRE